MHRKYNQIMERLTVTQVMRGRILQSVGRAELSPASRSVFVRFPAKRLLPLAACFAVLLAGVLALRGGSLPEPAPGPGTELPGVQLANGIVAAADRQALSEAVGFAVKEVTALPFAVQETVYTSFWGEMAQIDYSGEGQTACFRQSAGSGDNSGIYTQYAQTQTIEAAGSSVTLKGADGAYVLAIWESGGYAYSLSLSSGVSAQEWTEMIASVGEPPKDTAP